MAVRDEVYSVNWKPASGDTLEELLEAQHAEYYASKAKVEQPDRNLSLESRRRVAEALQYDQLGRLETEKVPRRFIVIGMDPVPVGIFVGAVAVLLFYRLAVPEHLRQEPKQAGVFVLGMVAGAFLGRWMASLL